MKLTDFRDEEALEVLADILEPSIEIMTDETIQRMFAKKDVKMFQVASCIIKNHKKSIMQILSAMHRSEGEYHCTLISLTKDVIELLSDKELLDFFKSQGQTMENESSGSAMENTEGGEE